MEHNRVKHKSGTFCCVLPGLCPQWPFAAAAFPLLAQFDDPRVLEQDISNQVS
jgi:hypothetical protein